MDIKNIGLNQHHYPAAQVQENKASTGADNEKAAAEVATTSHSRINGGVFIQNLEGYDTVKNFSSAEISSVKESVASNAILEANIEVINRELIPLNDVITSKLEEGASDMEISKLINEYSSKIENMNNGNKEILNGNYDIPTNNVINGVRNISKQDPLDNAAIIERNATENARSESFEEYAVKPGAAEGLKTVQYTATTERDSKVNWQVQNMKGKDVNFSTFTKDNETIEKNASDRKSSENRTLSANYTNVPKARHTVFLNESAASPNELKNNFFQHKEQLEEAARTYRSKIDAQMRLNEDMFMTKSVITELDGNRIKEGFSIQYIYSNMNADTLNKIIRG